MTTCSNCNTREECAATVNLCAWQNNGDELVAVARAAKAHLEFLDSWNAVAVQQVGDGADLTEWCRKEEELRKALKNALESLS